jgi:hypothetical protein
MKWLWGALTAGAVLAWGTTTDAGELIARRVSFQVPTPASEPGPLPVAGGEVPLYHCVKYKDLDNIHPCAVPKIVMIKDPCACSDPCSCCQPKCVAVRICVPPCGCETVKCSRDGDKVKYDYGDYAVELRVKKGYIEVDYDD